jgi:hypothetical protein
MHAGMSFFSQGSHGRGNRGRDNWNRGPRYNTSYHIATCMTPFEAVYGQNPPLVFSNIPGVSKVQEVENNIAVTRPFSTPSKPICPWFRIARRNKNIKVVLNDNLLKGTKFFFVCNPIRKIHSKQTIVRNFLPNFMVLVQFSSDWGRWLTNYLSPVIHVRDLTSLTPHIYRIIYFCVIKVDIS